MKRQPLSLHFKWRYFVCVLLALIAEIGMNNLYWAQEGPRRIPDLFFVNTEGISQKLSALSPFEALVLITRDIQCPICKKYGQTIAQLEKQYSAQKVIFLYLYTNATDTKEAIQAERASFGFLGQAIQDTEKQFQKTLQIQTTTEVFVLDAALTLCYRGAVDDQYGIGFSKEAPKSRYLEDVLRKVLQHRPVTIAQTQAPGCFLEAIPQTETTASTVTYHNQISRIIQKNCTVCHREGGAGPFALESYAQTVSRKGMIRFVLEEGIMPPWFTNTVGPWQNDRRLSEADKKHLLEWIQAGCPEGDPKEAPIPYVWEDGWTIGKPDLILKMPKIFSVPAQGTVDYQYFYVQNPLKETKWIQAMEIRSSAPQVVHHVLILLEEPRQPFESNKEFQRRFEGGIQSYFAAAIPGQNITWYEEQFAKELPPNAWLKFQLHYTPNGQIAKDQTEIGFVFRQTPPQHVVETSSAFTTKFEIPPYHAHYPVKGIYRFKKDGYLVSFAPHAHLRGKAFRYELFFPNKTSKMLLDIPHYDFNWQLRYQLKEPVKVPKGSVLQVTGWFDNSEKNPANPNPKMPVYFGEQTWEEMMIGYFEWYTQN